MLFMLAVIVVLAFAVILFLNFTIEFLSNRKSFQKKPSKENDFLEKAFYEKYKKSPVNFSLSSSLEYVEKKKEAAVQITGSEKLFITNCYIALFNALQSKNHHLLNMNPMFHLHSLKQREESMLSGGSTEKNPNVVRTKKKSKKIVEEKKEDVSWIMPTLDMHLIMKAIYNQSPLDNQEGEEPLKLERIISVSFLYNLDNSILMEIVQECLKGRERIILITKMILDPKNYFLKKINDFDLWNKDELLEIENKNIATVEEQKENEPNKQHNFYGLSPNLKNLTIFSTFLAIMSSLECKNQQSLLMIKNISSSLYSTLINYYKKQNILQSISLLKIDPLYDNIQRVCILSSNKTPEGISVETEDYLDFDCPAYSVPELVKMYSKRD